MAKRSPRAARSGAGIIGLTALASGATALLVGVGTSQFGGIVASGTPSFSNNGSAPLILGAPAGPRPAPRSGHPATGSVPSRTGHGGSSSTGSSSVRPAAEPQAGNAQAGAGPHGSTSTAAARSGGAASARAGAASGSGFTGTAASPGGSATPVGGQGLPRPGKPSAAPGGQPGTGSGTGPVIGRPGVHLGATGPTIGGGGPITGGMPGSAAGPGVHCARWVVHGGAPGWLGGVSRERITVVVTCTGQFTLTVGGRPPVVRPAISAPASPAGDHARPAAHPVPCAPHVARQRPTFTAARPATAPAGTRPRQAQTTADSPLQLRDLGHLRGQGKQSRCPQHSARVLAHTLLGHRSAVGGRHTAR